MLTFKLVCRGQWSSEGYKRFHLHRAGLRSSAPPGLEKPMSLQIPTEFEIWWSETSINPMILLKRPWRDWQRPQGEQKSFSLGNNSLRASLRFWAFLPCFRYLSSAQEGSQTSQGREWARNTYFQAVLLPRLPILVWMMETLFVVPGVGPAAQPKRTQVTVSWELGKVRLKSTSSH